MIERTGMTMSPIMTRVAMKPVIILTVIEVHLVGYDFVDSSKWFVPFTVVTATMVSCWAL